MTPQAPSVIRVPTPPDWLHKTFDPAEQYEIRTKTGKTLFKTEPGPQTWAMFSRCSEILIGGQRGGGKSVTMTAWMATGDLSLPADDQARASFILDKDFRGLFLREEYSSMVEFIEQAVEFFKPLGGKATGGASKPVVIEFESKAKLYFNHLNDESAFEKYKGWNLTRIGIEELTQIATLKRYLKLMGSLRSVERTRNGKKFPALRTQVMATTNPDGPGANWVKARFVELYSKGEKIPWNTVMRDRMTGDTRIYIPFPLEYNSYLGAETPAGKSYRAKLLAQDEVTRKQWMEGDWSAGSGQFFSEFRPRGPIGSEEKDKYPWANHVIKSAPLQPWWFRWGSGDWGFDHPAAWHKACRNEHDKRVHIYDELTLRHVGSFEMGAILAKWWHPDLVALKQAGAQPMVTVFLGADAFLKDDAGKTKAQQLEAGIKEVLGPYGAILLKYNESEQEAMLHDKKRAQMMFELRREELQGHMCIALKPAYFDRVAAWSYLRDWLRFRPAVLPLQTQDQRDAYLRDVYTTQGPMAYELQAAAVKELKPEILPKVQIWDVCRGAIRCLEAAQHDDSAGDDPHKTSKREDVRKFNADNEGKNGDDELESIRNLAVGFQEIETIMPRSVFVAEKVQAYQDSYAEAFGEPLTDPTRIAMVAMRQNQIYNKQNPPAGGSLTLPRRGAMLHRNLQ